MEALSEIVTEPVHQLMVRSWEREPILSTTGTRAAIGSLAARMEVLEEAVQELAAVVQELAHLQRSNGLY